MSEYSKYTKRELIELLETQEEMVDALREENRRLVPAVEITQLYHELRVHQEELEVQNQELRLMGEAIEHSRNRYATLYDYAPAAFISLDENGIIHDLNLTAASFLRNDRAVLIGKPFSVFLKGGNRRALFAHLKSALSSGRKQSVDLVLDLRMHHPIFVQLDSIAFKDDVHHKTLAWTCVSDITNRKLAENRLQASETNLSAVFENTTDAIWSVDTRYHIVTFNAPFNALRKHFSAQLPQPSGYADENRAQVQNPNGAVLESQMPFNYEWKSFYDRALKGERFSIVKEYRQGEDQRSFQFNFNPIRHDDTITGVTVFGKDVTEQNQLERELREARRKAEDVVRSKSNFFAHVSHEIRTPLSAILSYAALIKEDASDDRASTEIENFAEVIEKNTRNILSSVNNILALSKMDWEGFSLRREPVDLVQVISKQVELFSANALERDTDLICRFELNAGQEHAEVVGDPHSIEQVVSNLVNNSVKFTNNGSIELVLSDEDDRFAIRVTDTGPGISPEFLPHLFKEYRQEDEHSIRGSGLGLAISKRLIELMGGEISVESEVGKGSTFSVLFPKATAEQGSQKVGSMRGAA